MNNLSKYGVSELTKSETIEVNGGFGLLFCIFAAGMALAYYEERIKIN